MAAVGQQQPPPMSMGPNPVPAGVTREQIQQSYLRLKQLEQDGVPPDNPEYQKLHRLISAVKQQTYLAQQKQKAMQQQRLAQQQAQAGNVQAQGPPPPAPPPQAQPPSQPPTNVHPAVANANGTAPSAAGQASPVVNKDTSITPEQMALLRLQIQAFKILAKNMTLSTDLKKQLTQASMVAKESTASTRSPVVKAQSGTPQMPDPSIAPTSAPTASETEHVGRFRPFETFRNPYTQFRNQIPYSDHGYRGQQPQISSIIPLGVDVMKLLVERENILYNRLESRRAEIANMHANITSWNSSRIDGAEDDSIKRRLLIEYKKINLLEKQRALRLAMSREMMHADNLAMTANRSLYRRRKKMSIMEARATEKLEQQQRDAREFKEKKKQTDFLNSVVHQAEKLRTAALSNHSRYARLGRAVNSQHHYLEKEEQKRVERTAKQRLQALKANDEETYLKLLGQAKDTRITHLLRQTDGFLEQLAASVKDQQRAAMRKGAQEPDYSSSEEESEDEGGEPKRSRVDYYEVAHRIKEEVTAQATNLVGGTLKDYQLKGLQWMLSLYNNNLNGILADEMGLGKTIQTISLITYLIEKKREPGPYLVIVPLSTLTNWNNEFDKWAPSVKKIVYKGPPNARKQHQQQIRWGDFQVLLTTYEFIIKDRPILSKIKWLHMIVDEGHRMKNANSKLSSTITQYYTTRYRIILTGTPLQNNLPELWALLNFVLPNIFKSVKSFDEWFNTPFANTGGQDQMTLTEEESLLVIKRLHKVLRPFLLRRLKKDVEADLPDKQERVIKCTMSALQNKLYKQLVTSNRMTISDGKGGKTNMRGLSNMLMQLRKLCNHPFVFEEVEDQVNPTRGSNDSLWRTCGKFELLDRIMPKFQATGHRVLMFFQMTQIMNIMEDFLRLRGMKYLRLDGSTKADDRSDLLKLFNAPNSEYFCFLLSTRAGGLGLNLQTADTVVIFDSDWNPHQDLQAQDRAHRIGQKNEVRILRLITSNSVEEKILERANYKLDMDGKVIQAGKFDNKSTNEERDAMLRVMLETAEAVDNGSDEKEEMDDDELNLLMMRHDHELDTFRKMDEDREKESPYGPPPKKLPRLMAEHELPDIYLQDDTVVEEVVEEITGRGARERTRVKYDDGLTEEQWLEAVDNDEDAAAALEAAINRKQDKTARRQANKEKKTVASPPPSRDSSESPAPKKRNRKGKAEKRKIDEASLNGDSGPPAKRGRPGKQKTVETLSKEQRETIQQIMDNVHDTLMDLKDPDTGYELSTPFFDLPPKNDYPDYYQLIREPISLNQIGERINKRHYQSLRQFRRDIGLMAANCRQYNDDESTLVSDANKLEAKALELLKEETKDMGPEWKDFSEEDEAADGRSTAPVSSMGTPLAQGR